MTNHNIRAPLVSICVPTYNGREYLRECIESIRKQTLADFEVVVCDDESSDGTLELARQLAEGDTRFRFIPNPHRLGLVGNWNNCMNLARGEWIKFVFQDDLLESRCLELLVEACQKRGQRFGFCRRQVMLDEKTTDETRIHLTQMQELISEIYGPADSYVDPQAFARVAMQNPHWNIIGEPTVTLFHRSLVREFDFFTPALIQRCDMEYWVRLGTNVGVVHVAEFLATYRFHDKSMTSRNLARRKYAMTMLDPLITQYLFLHEKYYAAFRKELFRTSGRLLTWWRLVRLAHKAWETAQDPSAAPELPANWQQATKMYPRFRTLALIGQVLVPIRLALSAVGLNKLQKNKS